MTAHPWDRATRAASLLAGPTGGLGGIWVRARAGRVQEVYLALLARALPGLRRIGPATDDLALHGTLDVTASLAEGRRVHRAGLLDDTAPILLTSAERCTPNRAAHLAAWIDRGGTLVLMDEGDIDDDAPPAALTDRLALFADLNGVRAADCQTAPDIQPFRTLAELPDDHLIALTRLAATLGIVGLRAPLQAAAATRLHAAERRRQTATVEDLEGAVELVLAHRALTLPGEDPADAPPPPPEDASNTDTANDSPIDLTEDRLITAAETALPAELLADLAKKQSRRAATGNGAGALALSTERGRPLPPRRGRPGSRKKIDLIATLRAAAPWQRIRKQTDGRVAVRASDIHLKRHAEQSARLVIFVVDASGSAAMARLAEAKGAVSILLGEAYRSRDSVALISFRGSDAEVLLPPTKALVAAKNRLAALPGGGATPLADALRQAADLADRARRDGTDPVVVLMTDGRANTALDGVIDRARATDEALTMAGRVAATGAEALILDTGNRRNPGLAALGQRLGADCLPLPRGGARDVAALITADRR